MDLNNSPINPEKIPFDIESLSSDAMNNLPDVIADSESLGSVKNDLIRGFGQKDLRRKLVGVGVLPAMLIILVILLIAGIQLKRNSTTLDTASTENQEIVNLIDSSKLPILTAISNSQSLKQIVFNETIVANGEIVLSPSLQPTESVSGQIYFDQTENILKLYDGNSYRSVVSLSEGQEICLVGSECGFLTASDLPTATSLPQGLSVASSPTFSSITLSGDLSVSNGGTGASSFASNALLMGAGTDAISTTNVPLAGQLLISSAQGVPAFVTTSGDVSVTSSGVLDIASNTIGSVEISNSGVVAGTYGSVTEYPVFTVDADGRITSATSSTLPGGGLGVGAINSLVGAITLQGTANQVTVTDNGTDTITLSLPQSINTSSSPTFSSLNLSSSILISGDTINDFAGTGLQVVANTLQTTLGLSVDGSEITDGSVGNSDLANSSLTVSAGTGLSGGGVVSLGGTVALSLTNDFGSSVDTGEITNGTLLFADLSQNGCSNDDVIKWNGSAWICGADSTGSGNNTFSTIDAPTGTDPVADSTSDTLFFIASSGITITGDSTTDTLTILNTGDTNGSDDVLLTTGFGGDVSGTYDNIQLGTGSVTTTEIANATILFADIASNSCSSNDIIQWNGSAWICGTDSTADADADPTNELQNLFATFAAPAGTSVVVDSNTDTFTFADGSGITITGDGTTDTITVAAVLGADISGTEIVDGTIEEVDFEVTNAAVDNYILTYDSATGGFTWVDPTTAGSSQNLFETFNTPNGTDPVADSTTDLINFTDGANIIITGTSGTDTIDIALSNTPTISGLVTLNGGLNLETGDTLTVNGDGFTDFTGTGLQIVSGSLQTTLGTTVDLASEITGTLSVGDGGTGATTTQGAINAISQLTTTGDILYYNGTNSTRLARGSSGDCLTSNGSTIVWTSCAGAAGGVSSINALTGATSILGTANQITISTSSPNITLSLPDSVVLGQSSGSAGTLALYDGQTGGSENTGALQVISTLGQNTTYTLPDPGSASADICLSTGNCVGGSGGGAPNSGEYVTYSANATLSAERVLSNGTNSNIDTGTAGQIQIDVVDNPTFTGLVTLNGGLTVEAGDTLIFNGDSFTDLTGTGLSVSSGVLQTTLGTDISGTEIVDNTIEEADIESTNSATDNYVLTFDSASGGFTWVDPTSVGYDSSWILSDGATTQIIDNGETFTIVADTGIDVTVSATNTLTILNTGDTNGSDDVLLTTGFGGDVSGTYDNIQLGTGSVTTTEIANATILFADIASNSCSSNDIIQWNGSAWICGTDSTADADADPTNELQNLFATFAAPAGTSVVVDSNTDTFTFADGSGITITGDGTTDTITVAAVLGADISGTEIVDGTIEEVDFEVTNAAVDNYILTYDSATGGFTWVDPTTAGSSQNLFETFNTPNGTDPVADSTTDLINILDGTNVLVTGDSTTDSITIAVVDNPTFSGLLTANAGINIGASQLLSIGGDSIDDFVGTGLQLVSGDLQTTLGTSVDLSTEINGTLGVGNGGTGASTTQGAINALSQLTTNGDLLYNDGTNSTRLARGSNGQCLTSNATTLEWVSCAGTGTTFFSIQGTSGISQSINGGDVVTVAAGTNITTTGSATDTITVATVANPSFSTSVTTPTLTSTVGLAVTGGSTLTLGSTGAGNDVIINGADILDVQDDATFAGTLGVTGVVTLTSDLSVNGNTTLGNAVTDNFTFTAAIQGTNALIFDGSTDDTNEITLAVTNPGADFTITLPAETGTICTTGSVCLGYQASGAYLTASLTDNITDALDFQEGTNNYININTTDTTEEIQFGNTTTNPLYTFLGSGQLLVEGGLDVAGSTLNVDPNPYYPGDLAGTVLVNGSIHFSNSTPAVGSAGLVGGVTSEDPATTPGDYYGADLYSLVYNNGNAQDYSGSSSVAVRGSSSLGAASTTLLNAIGLQGSAGITFNGTGSTITNAIALQALNPSVVTGSITNGYGLFVENQTAATNDYGIYVAGADTYALWVDTGATRLDGTLEVGGNTTLTGDLAVNGDDITSIGDLTITPAGGQLVLSGDLEVTAGNYISLAGGNTASRPVSPTEGMVYYDTDTKQLLTYANGKWQADRSTATKIVAANNSSQALKDSADYVADGTGDQTEINTALTAAAGGKVYLAEGTYTLSAAISIPNSTSLVGSGAGTIITIPNALNIDFSAIVNSDTVTGTSVTVRDLVLEGNKSNQSGSFAMAGIDFNFIGTASIVGATIQNVQSNNWYSIGGGSNCQIGLGICVRNSGKNTLTGNSTSGNDSSGIYLSSVVNSTVNSNISNANGGSGIELGGSGNTVNGNTANSNSTAGIITVSSTNSSISGNTLNDNLNYGLYINASSGQTVTSNAVTGNANRGIYVASSNNNIITTNTVIDSGDVSTNSGIFIEDSDYNTVTNNLISDTSCSFTCYAINIFDVNSDKNYLESNRFTGSAVSPASINDTGTGTIYAGQQTNTTTSTNSDVSDFRFRGSANSATAFLIQNASGASILNVDTTNGELELGDSATAGKLVISDGSSNTGTILLNSTSGNYTFTIPTVTANDTFCLATVGNCSAIGSAGGALTGTYPAPTLAGVTGTGSVTFQSSTTGVLETDSSNFYFDNANNRLAVGTATVGNNILTINNAATTDDIVEFQDNGAAVVTITDGGNIIAGATTGVTGTTTGSGTNTTTLTLTTDAFSVNDVVFIDNAGQDYYTRITVDPGTGSYTVSPAVTFETTRTVTKYNSQNVGATSTDYTTQTQRFFQGYFLGGVVTGAGSTTLSDQSLMSTGALYVKTNGENTRLTIDTSGNSTFSGNVTASGGVASIGVNDTGAGGNVLNVYGGATGAAEGGQISLYTSADWDTTLNSYDIDVYQDSFRIFNGGGTSFKLNSGSNGTELTYTQSDDADATDTNNGLEINVTSSSGDADTLRGININNLTAGTATEVALRVGTGWDTDLQFADTSPIISVANTGTLSFNDGAGNALFSIADGGSVGNGTLTGDLTVSGGNVGIGTAALSATALVVKTIGGSAGNTATGIRIESTASASQYCEERASDGATTGNYHLDCYGYTAGNPSGRIMLSYYSGNGVVLGNGTTSTTSNIQIGTGGTAFNGLKSCTIDWNPANTTNGNTTSQTFILGTDGCTGFPTDGTVIGVSEPLSGVTYSSGTCNAGFACEFGWTGKDDVTLDVNTVKSYNTAGAAQKIELKIGNYTGASVDVSSAVFRIWYIDQ